MNKKWIFILVFAMIMISSSKDDDIKTLDELTKLEIDADIEKTVRRIENVGIKGNYEYVDILIEQSQSNIEKIKKASGQSLEKIADLDFGFSKVEDGQNSMAVKNTISWWDENKKILVRDYIFKKYKPYLEREFNGRAKAKTKGSFKIVIRDYLLRATVSSEIRKTKFSYIS